ncbi:MAG: TauD/TfdA dioxygenase family protein [bacterium]
MIHHPHAVFDNRAKRYEHLTVLPLASAMGAEVSGVNISDLSDQAFEEIRDALYRHKMIFFRDQNISHAEHEAFSERFGSFGKDAYTEGLEGYEHIQPVIRLAEDPVAIIFGSGWHFDSPFLPDPPAITTLRGVDTPPYGGDTMWANAVLAYSALSETMKSVLKPLKVRMSIQNFMLEIQRAKLDMGAAEIKTSVKESSDPEMAQQKLVGSVHPIVRVHPVTGESALFCDRTYTTNIEGMHSDEGKSIIEFLANHLTQPAFTCRLRWQPGTIAIWDNRLCAHQAFNDHDGFRREMYRTIVTDEHG